MIETPKAAESMSKLALAHGWRTRLAITEGDFREKHYESVLVRMAKGDRRMVAQYLNGKAVTAYEWRAEMRVIASRVPFAELRRKLRDESND